MFYSIDGVCAMHGLVAHKGWERRGGDTKERERGGEVCWKWDKVTITQDCPEQYNFIQQGSTMVPQIITSTKTQEF